MWIFSRNWTVYCFLKSQIGNLSVIKFKQWESTDRTILVNTELPTTEFLTLLVNKIDCLTVHHYVSKAQSKFCRELKQSLCEVCYWMNAFYKAINYEGETTPWFAKIPYNLLSSPPLSNSHFILFLRSLILMEQFHTTACVFSLIACSIILLPSTNF